MTKKNKNERTKIRNERGALFLILEKLKKYITRECNENLYTNSLDNLDEMAKLKETHDLERLNHKQKENLNRTITAEVIESVIKNLHKRKGQDQIALLVNSTEH